MVSSNEMTHQPQDDFESCMEHAEAWMKAIQERLRINDNTQGPRSALEARLRETEIICDLEPEGQFKMELVLMKAETLLQESSEDEKHEIQGKLKDIKSMFEETTTYMTHCHSRIEWVWLHWSEYLKARDEFTLWIHNMRLTIEPDVELQLGLKEKQWQYSHAQVLLKDVQNQATLLDRLLEEAAALYNRIGDPSVDEDVQNQMKAEYERIKKKAQERVELLQRIMADHSEYEENVHQFRDWLNDVIEKLKGCVGTTSESSVSKLQTFQDIANDVKFGQQKLEELQVQSVSIIVSTSPLGAENIKAEQEELRNALAQLKLMNEEEMESLMKANESESSFQELTKHIEEEIQEFRKVIETLESNLGTEEKVKNEDQLISLWRQRVTTRFALVDEEAREERLKLLLKELFRFSHDVQETSNSAMAVIREYRSATIKAFKLCTESESELKQCFQNPLREFHHWKSAIQRVLDATANMTDRPMIQDFSLQIETLMNESSRLKDRLMMVQLNKDILSGIFGDQKAETLLNKVVSAAKEREALYNSLLQRALSFQTSESQSELFDAAFEALQNSLQTIGRKVEEENEPQPDLVGKETQLQRLQMLHEELLKLEPQFEMLGTNDQLSPSHKSKMNQLASERLTVYRSLEIMLKNSRQYFNDHRRLNNNLLDLQRWMMETRQNLESYQDINQEQNLDNEERHSERLFAEFPEKEMQLQQVESQGQRVMENSSPDGASHIQSELEQLKTSWECLLQLLKDLAWLHTKNDFSEIEMDAGKKTMIKGNKRMFRSRSYSADDITLFESMPDEQNEQGLEITFSGDEMDISGSESDVGFRQSTFGITPQPGQERTSDGRIKGAERMQQDIAITYSPEDEFTASGSKVSEYEYEWASELPSDAEAAGIKMDKSRSQQAHGFNSSSVEEMTDLGEDRDEDRGEWTFSKHTHFRDDISTPRMSVPGAGHQQTITFHSEAEASGNKKTSGGSQPLTGLTTIPEDEMSSSSNKMPASESSWTIGLPSTEKPGTKQSTVQHKLTIGEPSDCGASGNKMAAAGQKLAIGITTDAKVFGSKMPADGSQQHSGLSTSTVDGENMSAAGSAWTIRLPSEAETPETNMFSVGHKWAIGRTPDEEEFGSKMPGGGSQQRSVLSTSTGDGTNMSSAESARTIGLPSEAEANRTNRFSAEHKWTIASHSEAAAFGEEISETGHESTMGLPSVTDTSGKKMSTAGYKGMIGLPLDAEASGEELFAVEHKRAIDLPSDTDVSEGKMSAGGHKWKIETYSEGDVSGENMSGHKSTIQLTPDADAIRKKKSSAEHKWTVRSSSEAEASGNKLAGGKSQQLPGLSTSSVDEMTTTGKKISTSGHKWAFGLPSEADVLKGKMAAGGHKWAIGSYSEGDVPGEKMSGHKSTIQLTPEDEVARNKKSATGYHWTGGSSFDVEVSGNKLPGGEIRQRTGLSTSNVDEMTTSGKKMPAAEHKWAIGSYSEGEASGEPMAGGEHQQSSGLRFSSVHEITGEDMDSEGNKFTIGLPYHLNDKMTANGENTESVGSGQTPGLYFFPEDEMTALVERMGKAGRKQTGLSVHVDGDNLSAGKKKSNMGGKHISGATSYSGHGITAPGGNMAAEGSEWTVKFPSRSAKGMSEFSGQINGAEKILFPEIKDSTEYSRLMKEFEEWLRVENSKLNKLRLTRTSNSEEDIDMRRKTLLMLKTRVPEGRRLFEALRHYRPAMGVTEDLQMEDLRYRWMLYKSKLKDSDNISSLEDLEEPVRLQKKPPGMCAFLHRVCCAALPLQLLLLLLLLLAFLLPLAEENHSCTLANNFARSFSLMLRYDKPPPT